MSELPEPMELHCRLSREQMAQALKVRDSGNQVFWGYVGAGAAVVLGLSALLIFKSDWGLSPEAGIFLFLGAALSAGMSAALLAMHRKGVIEQEMAWQAQDGGYWLRFGPEGIEQRGALVEWRGRWSLLREVRAMGQSTALLLDRGLILVPNGQLPEGTSPEKFRAALIAWKEAA
ncbi:hypothetical protein [Oceanicola sp. 502str15]|uniref:hypothetical protein n=1 Tax=Oceanicola sp. 502str15 TaxID=2696061 RepID=UPI0020964E70|nr:hypothetical protein [Oceanicola sp. 502str15]MCO6384034.1 hypothetical protein [Oceanicola sp. 502str15]